MLDTKSIGILRVGHYAPDLQSAIVHYCDSAGWRWPITLLNVVESSLTILRGLFAPQLSDSIVTVIEVHNSRTPYDPWLMCGKVDIADLHHWPPQEYET